ncbi:uncharacterized protein PAC_14051 [Phialocephala subalpina]|uniref:Zn(2)-C6 fungal-type domain-containing protein n=1 Tax=Phialocephala subalpina TaxID=576137 RepID=A0A1L7XGK7_9HELO|nr:uncharacterized protein PAC_14051 [Phialocephala subalpina]
MSGHSVQKKENRRDTMSARVMKAHHKCDELKPRCSRCLRYSEECTYPVPKEESSKLFKPTTDSEISGPLRPTGSIERPKDINNFTSELNLGDLGLLHEWTMSAYTGFVDQPRTEHLWQAEIPRMALKHPFLMRGVLAVSALYKGRMEPDKKPHYLQVAAYHQNLALPAYRYIVEDLDNRMDRENAGAVLAFGHLTTAYAFASPHAPGSILFAGLCASTGVPEWLYLTRGCRKIMVMAKDWISSGPMNLVMRDIDSPIDLSLSPDDHHLAALAEHLESLPISGPEDSEEMDAFREALSQLRRSFALPWQAGDPLSAKFSCFAWVEFIPQRYLELLSVLRPVALVILSYFCVLLHQCGHFWHIKGAAERIIGEMYNILEDDWHDWITWPLQRVLNQ